MFPSKLRYLGIGTSAITSLEIPKPLFDLRHLEQLESVNVCTAAKYDWEFPTNIRSINLEGFMDLDDISINHPNLVHFCDTTNTEQVFSHGKDNPITFPSRVKKLDLTSAYFSVPKDEIEIERETMRLNQNHDEHNQLLNQWPKYQRVKFPESLVELRVNGLAKDLLGTEHVIVIDFRMCELPQLSMLSFEQTWDQIIVNNYLPRSLTKINFYNVADLQFDMLSDLENLVEIRINTCFLAPNSNKQAAQFPPHLQVLDISSSRVDSPMACSLVPNIRSLTLADNNASVLISGDRHELSIVPKIEAATGDAKNSGTFYGPIIAIPEIRSFDFKWMENLIDINLSFLILQECPLFPPYIEKVTLTWCSIERFPLDNDGRFIFPDTLEYLNLKENKFTWDSLMSIHAPNLKCLDISMAPKFHLPEVNRETNSDSDEVSWTDTKVFSKFTKLEELILTNNNLSNLMPHELHPNIFGPSIKYLNVMGCNLSKETAKGIIDLVLAKPDFERLIIEDSLVGEEYQRWVDNITIVSDEEHL
ncbi:predicted protein [Candida tropicalis MYA-3404]|uniref:Uncharacterized protein n=1 Tax=Candida tropicalis (strain ATCC MYA-3404 / T1) TaxID=294747 RepID=C5M8H8_CANTT|nr:predicted protein [Candida tropicalis MYA-3404]EER33882.1 predicted protein [Candida tropicalis MYA-3404]KAG4407738.1 hypothetical protein JTP64_003273 [Candida tropicalis]